MKSIAIRELTGARIRLAAQEHEVLAVTSDRVLSAVLLPVEQRLVDQLLDRNLSEIVHGIQLGEKAAANGDVGTELDDLLDEPQASVPIPRSPRSARRIVPVSIRGLSATRIAQAAENKELLGITNHRALVALLMPVSQRWVDYIVQSNLSRIVKGIGIGEFEAEYGEISDLEELAADTRSPNADDSARADVAAVAREPHSTW